MWVLKLGGWTSGHTRHWGFAIKRTLEKTWTDLGQERKEDMKWGEETSQDEESLFLGRKHCDVYDFVTFPRGNVGDRVFDNAAQK